VTSKETGWMIGGGKQDGCAKTAKRFCQGRVLLRLLINAMPCQSRPAAVAIFFAAENLGVFQQLGHAVVIAVELGTAGISPTADRPNKRSTSSVPFRVSSSRSCRNAAQKPSPKPKIAATPRFSGIFGITGFVGGSAASTMRMLLALRLGGNTCFFQSL